MNIVNLRLKWAAILLAVGATALLAHGQTASTSYDYNGGSQDDPGARKTLVAKDGSIFVLGTGKSTRGDYDMVLLKYKMVGGAFQLQWRAFYDKAVADVHGNDIGVGLALDDNFNAYMLGTSDSGSADGDDVVVYGVNSSGQQLWSGDGAVRIDVGNTKNTATDMAFEQASGELRISGYTGTIGQDTKGLTAVVLTSGSRQERLARLVWNEQRRRRPGA